MEPTKQKPGQLVLVALPAVVPEKVVAKVAAIPNDKALNICSRLMNAANAFMKAREDLVAVSTEKTQTGIDLTAGTIPTSLEASSLKHATAADFNNLMGSVTALVTWMDANGHTGNFQKVRP